jgi:hypothetical protein
MKSAIVVKALTLVPAQWVRVRNLRDLHYTTHQGPGRFWLRPYERVEAEGQGFHINSTQYVLVENRASRERRIVRGPRIWIPDINEDGQLCNAIAVGRDEYLIIQDTNTGIKRIHKEPKGLWFPTDADAYVTWERHTAMPLAYNEYVHIKDTLSGRQRVVEGPGLWYPEPYEEGKKDTCIWLNTNDFVSVEDKTTGDTMIVRGPRQWRPGPNEVWKKGNSVSLTPLQYIVVNNKRTGERRTVKGPEVPVWVPEPYEHASEVQEAVRMSKTQYIHIENRASGVVKMVRGACLWFPDHPDERPRGQVTEAMVLGHDEFVNVKCVATGRRWIEQGQKLLFLDATHEVEGGVHKSVPLTGREYLRLSVAPRFRFSKNRGAPEPSIPGIADDG